MRNLKTGDILNCTPKGVFAKFQKKTIALFIEIWNKPFVIDGITIIPFDKFEAKYNIEVRRSLLDINKTNISLKALEKLGGDLKGADFVAFCYGVKTNDFYNWQIKNHFICIL